MGPFRIAICLLLILLNTEIQAAKDRQNDEAASKHRKDDETRAFFDLKSMLKGLDEAGEEQNEERNEEVFPDADEEMFSDDEEEMFSEIKRGKLPSNAPILNKYDTVKAEQAKHTAQEQQDILAKHNTFRSKAGSSNMEYMSWSDDLALLAGLWASTCYLGHGQVNHDITTRFKNNKIALGQNVWVGGNKPDGPGSVAAWHNNEKPHYKYNKKKCKRGKVCGHYTQVVWASTTEVGCSRGYCQFTVDENGIEDKSGKKNIWLEVCNYAPGGNYAGQKPFVKGPACTFCESLSGFCKDNMCVSPHQAASLKGVACSLTDKCENCATFDANQCKCKCFEGYVGPSCQFPCEDNYRKGCYKDYFPSSCDKNDRIPKLCPMMCGLCEPLWDDCVP